MNFKAVMVKEDVDDLINENLNGIKKYIFVEKAIKFYIKNKK